MADEFFDDEEELMQAAGEPAGESLDAAASEAEDAALKDANRALSQAKGEYVRDVPPFWMVLAIAAIALLLGVIVGYLIGTTTTINSLESSSATTAADSSSYELPEGHPSVTVDEDGNATVADTGSSAE